MSAPSEGQEQYITFFKSDEKIVPRSVWGRFVKLRWLTVWFTQLLYYGLAWVQYDDRQLLLFDLEARRFFIGPLVFYPQDFIYLTALLVVCALSLFLFTAVAGRVWCGYACPQTVYTEIFMWFERKIEGDRAQRLRLAKAPFGPEKVLQVGSKHAVWVAFALLTGFTFVGYFTPIRELAAEVTAFSLGPWEMFWVGFYSFATYGNAGWMREQVCKYMCPYARFQSAMFDKDTLLVTYDESRGEPRGARGKHADAKAKGLGSCVDCGLCVQVCPTGIDIRNGLQYECIGCAACIDVCDTVMDKMGYEKGLVRYSTQHALDEGWGGREILKRLFRPRVLVYTAIVWTLIAAVGFSLAMRQDLRVDIVKDRQVQYRLVEDGVIENLYRVLLMNATEKPMKVTASLNSKDDILIAGESEWLLESTESRWVVMHLHGQPETVTKGIYNVKLSFTSQRLDKGVVQADTLETIEEKAIFMAP